MVIAIVVLAIIAAFYGALYLGTALADFVVDHKWY